MRLISVCLSPETKIFLHIDKKLELTDEQLENLLRFEDVYLTDERFGGELDTRSLVDIAMSMVKKAKSVEHILNIQFKYFLLLSGQDYLIKPIEYINDSLKQVYPEPLIDCTPYDKDNWIFHKFKHSPTVLSLSHWIKTHYARLSFPVLFCAKIIRRLICIFIRLFQLTYYDRLKKIGISLYGGSAWWILPDIAIDYILSEYEANHNYVDTLLSSNTPEETFFQTLTMRSSVKDLVHINPPDMVAQNCKTWAYFSDNGKPFMGHPYIFTSEEYGKLLSSDCWIARKFDSNIDSNILNMLDSVLNS